MTFFLPTTNVSMLPPHRGPPACRVDGKRRPSTGLAAGIDCELRLRPVARAASGTKQQG